MATETHRVPTVEELCRLSDSECDELVVRARNWPEKLREQLADNFQAASQRHAQEAAELRAFKALRQAARRAVNDDDPEAV